MYIVENDFQNKPGNAGRADVSTVLDGKVEHHKTKLYTDRTIPGFPPVETLARNQVRNNFQIGKKSLQLNIVCGKFQNFDDSFTNSWKAGVFDIGRISFFNCTGCYVS